MKDRLSLNKIFNFLNTEKLNLDTDPQKIHEIIQIFNRVSYSRPKQTCLSKCLALKFILNKNKLSSTLIIGVRKTNLKNIESHAWIDFEENIRFLDRSDLSEYKVIHKVN